MHVTWDTLARKFSNILCHLFKYNLSVTNKESNMTVYDDTVYILSTYHHIIFFVCHGQILYAIFENIGP